MWSWKRIVGTVGLGALGIGSILLGQPVLGIGFLSAAGGLAAGTSLPPVQPPSKRVPPQVDRRVRPLP